MNTINFKRYAAIIILIVIVVAIVWIWQAVRVNAPVGAGQYYASTTAQSIPAQTSPSQSTQKASGGVSPAKPAAPVQGGSYSAYLTNLRAEQNACQNAAGKQYGRLYASLQSGASESFYNPKTGACYMEATGTAKAPYSASSTAVIYFYNAAKDTPLAYCLDSTGKTFADSEWTCTNGANGQSIPKAEFNAIVYQYTVQ